MITALQIERAPFMLSRELNQDSLQGLINGLISVIWCQGYYPRQLCDMVLPNIRKALEASHYTLTRDLQSLGTSIGEASENKENEARYLASALATAKRIRHDIFHPARSPIDQFRLELDELWPYGATVARYQGGPMLSGILRRWKQGGQANPHIDQMDIPLLKPLTLSRRIGVNVYLAVPPENGGGEIEFWDRVTDERSYENAKRTDYGLNRSDLGPCLQAIKPGQGDLIAFDAARIHSVAQVIAGERVTAACFIGVAGEPRGPLVTFA